MRGGCCPACGSAAPTCPAWIAGRPWRRSTSAFASYGAGRLIVRTSAGDVTVPYADVAREARVDEMVDAAMATGRSGTTFERAVGEVRLAASGRTLDPWLTFDETALKAKVDAGLANLARPPVDSTIVMGPKTITVTPSQTGRSFDGTAAVQAAIAALRRTDAPDELVVEADGVTTQPAHGLRDTLAAKHAAERMARGVIVTRGTDKWAIKAAVVRSWIHFETQADGSPWPVVDPTAISKALTDVAKAVKVPAVSASYLKARNGKVVGVTPDKPGHKLDSAAMATAIAKVVQDRAGWVKGANVKVRLAPVAPKLTTEEAARTAPVMQVLGTWKTWFPVNDHNFFGANIWIPAKIIDGTVLRPGQKFEWWSAVGPVTPSRGFGPGGFIAGNHTEPTGALGGGMCSSSTTLFNAALRAGLQMGARSNHKYYIFRYPLGLDATVSKTRGGGSQTMSFTNDMKHPVVIRTFRYTAGGRGWVRYEIWGIPDGRTVSLSQPSVSNVRQAVTSTVFVSNSPPGCPHADRVPGRRDGRGRLAGRAQGREGHPLGDVPDALRPVERRHPGGSLGGLRRLDRMSPCTASARRHRSNPMSGWPRSTTSAGPSSRRSMPGSGAPTPTPSAMSTTAS